MTPGGPTGPPAWDDVTYVLPLRAHAPLLDTDFVGYLAQLADLVRVIVVDGSPAAVWQTHEISWDQRVCHLKVESTTRNGKVAGVCDGLAAAVTPYVIIADDDVRYFEPELARMRQLLAVHDAVVPQNYFQPMVWHAWWDSGRSLLNRAGRGDYAGTIGVRRQAFVDTGGYCGAVLFENLELVRTFQANGFDVRREPGLLVARRPPSSQHFLGQRVRQAYDSFAQPSRLAVELAILPTLIWWSARRRTGQTVMAAALLTLCAEVGRRQHGGRAAFPPRCSVAAPLWCLERGVCSWLAMLQRLRGGVPYAGSRIAAAAHPVAQLSGSACPQRPCSCDTAFRPAYR